MPIIQEESDSFSVKIEQKLNFNKAKLAVNKYHDAVTAKNENTNMSRPKISTYTIQKIKQNEDARISKMAEHMAKMTEVTLQKIKQNEDARISKMAEHMAKMTEDTISQFEQIHNEPSMNVLKHTRLIEQLNLPCFQ